MKENKITRKFKYKIIDLFLVMVCLLGIFFPGCKQDAVVNANLYTGPIEPYWPTAGWRKVEPERVGLNSNTLATTVSKISNNQVAGVHSLLIIRNGYLALEEYFNGSGPEDVHTLQSDTKSVTSLLLGIAFTQGKIASVDTKVLDYFEYENIQNMNTRKSSLRIQDLLTMRTGLDWSEANYSNSPLKQLNECGCDWLNFVLDWPMASQPGTQFQYNSGGVITLGGILRNATATSVDTFAQRYLFNPLGIQKVRWAYGQPDRLPHMGGGLSLRSQDMAKIGFLVMNKGRWEDKQIVSEEWINQSTSPKTGTNNFWYRSEQYGYLWWLFPLDLANSQRNEFIITVSGSGGQWIFIIPKYDLIIVTTGNMPQMWQALDLVYGDILTSLQ